MLLVVMMMVMMRRLRILLPQYTVLSHIATRVRIQKVLGLTLSLWLRRVIAAVHSLATLRVPSTLEVLDNGVDWYDHDGGDNGEE